MARFRINIFYVISSICSFVLVGYLWLVFLPVYELAVEYESIRNVAFIITAFLLLSAGIQLFLAIKKEQTPNDEASSYY